MSRLEWIISGLLGLTIVAAVAGFVFWTTARGQTDTHVDAGSPAMDGNAGHSAMQAYDMALTAAGAWAADAQLLSASATWPAGSSFATGVANWGFRFYSHSETRSALYAVNGNEARQVRVAPAQEDVAPLSPDGWLLDSPEVVDIILRNGGKEFLNGAGAPSLTLTLDLVEQFQWQARVIDMETNEVFSMTVNPTSGAASAPILPAGDW